MQEFIQEIKVPIMKESTKLIQKCARIMIIIMNNKAIFLRKKMVGINDFNH
jgi:hypothetical protein